MDYKIAICDDSSADREYISSLVTRWGKRERHTVALSTFCSAEEFLFGYEEDPNFDILLLDIEMGGMDGVTMAKKLRRVNDSVQIIFVTGYNDYIAEGYEVAALHYLLKPVNEGKLFSVLNRAAEKLKRDEKVLKFEVGGEVSRVPENVTVKMTLGELERELDERFYRVSRSAIVNLAYISRVTKTEIKLSEGSVIPLPRGAYEGVNRAIINMK